MKKIKYMKKIKKYNNIKIKKNNLINLINHNDKKQLLIFN